MPRNEVPDDLLVKFAERLNKGETRRKLAAELQGMGYQVSPSTIYMRAVALRQMKEAIERGVEEGRELGLELARHAEPAVVAQPEASPRLTLPLPTRRLEPVNRLEGDLGDLRDQVEFLLDAARDTNPRGLNALSRAVAPPRYRPCPTLKELRESFERHNFFLTPDQSFAVHEAIISGKPILGDGPPGTGKSTLAEQVALAMGLDPENKTHYHKVFCTPDMQKEDAIYSWDDGKRLLDIQLVREMAAKFPIEDVIDIFRTVGENAYSSRYLNLHSLLRPCVIPYRTVVLVDEVDKTYPEFDSLLLDLVLNNQFEVPGFGPVGRREFDPKTSPIFIFTTNRERELNRALARRMKPVWFDYLPEKLEARVLAAKCGVDEMKAGRAAQFFYKVRDGNTGLHLHQPPSTAEAIETVQALVRAGVEITPQSMLQYHPHWVKYRRDFDTIKDRYCKKGAWAETI